MENALTVLKNKDQLLPIKNLEHKKIAYINFGDASGTDFLNQLKLYAPIDFVKADDLASYITKLKGYDYVIAGFHKSNQTPWKGYKFTNKELVWLHEIARKNKTILAVFASPYSLLNIKSFANLEAVLVAYQNSEIAQEITAQTIFGAIEASHI